MDELFKPITNNLGSLAAWQPVLCSCFLKRLCFGEKKEKKMNTATITLLKENGNRFPIASLLPMVAFSFNCTNNEPNVSTLVFIAEKLLLPQNMWVYCSAKLANGQEPIKFTKRTDKRQKPSSEKEVLLHDVVLQYNTIRKENEKARQRESRTTFSGTVAVQTVVVPIGYTGDKIEYLSALIVRLEPYSWLNNLRVSFNITPRAQQSEIFRILCFRMETSQFVTSFVTGVRNGGKVCDRENVYKEKILRPLGAWQETESLLVDKDFITNRLNACHSLYAYRFSDFLNAILVQDTKCFAADVCQKRKRDSKQSYKSKKIKQSASEKQSLGISSGTAVDPKVTSDGSYNIESIGQDLTYPGSITYLPSLNQTSESNNLCILDNGYFRSNSIQIEGGNSSIQIENDKFNCSQVHPKSEHNDNSVVVVDSYLDLERFK